MTQRDRSAPPTIPHGRGRSLPVLRGNPWSVPGYCADTAIRSQPLLAQSYTPNGLPASLTDASGNATAYSHDGFDRLSTTTCPGGSTEALTYDANDNVLSQTTRATQTIVFTYDTLDRLATKTPPHPAPVVSCAYDLRGG
ncbi:MAG: RHS repeat protein [Burkholderiales bacterium]|nr:RHS repeat protein [Burkholderiales bacterium]